MGNFIENGFRFRGGYSICQDDYEFVFGKHENGKWFAVDKIIYKEVESGAISPISLRLHAFEAQELFNLLWSMGLRPKDGTGNGGHIESLKYHLEDMRKLVFKEPK